MKNWKALLPVLLFLVITSCASVPKESVELSATVGRDLAIVHDSHIQMTRLLFSKMKEDVNRFVDKTYAPYQISLAMERQKELAESDDAAENRKSLFLAIKAAFSPGASEELQAQVLTGMGIFVEKINTDIESMREELLTPLIEQEQQVIASIDRAYQQIHYANSIVTGHLSSIVKVHEVQNEILDEIGVDRDLRTDIGTSLSQISGEISNIVDKAEMADGKMEEIETAAESLKSAFDTMKMKLSGEAEKE